MIAFLALTYHIHILQLLAQGLLGQGATNLGKDGRCLFYASIFWSSTRRIQFLFFFS